MSGLRHAAVAGMFYPADPQELAATVDGLIAAGAERLARAEAGRRLRPAAIIAPHAGYPYSGPVAGTAFAALRDDGPPVERAVIIGPSHHVAFDGFAAPSASAFETPLGPVEVDHQALDELRDIPGLRVFDSAHRDEHALEVELPFLLAVAGPAVRIVPLVIGDADPQHTAGLLGRFIDDPATVLIVSSDLSHYLPYPVAREVDSATADIIAGLDDDRLGGDRACGYRGVRGLLVLARRRGLRVRLLDLRNSGDTAGGRDRVVGYGAFAAGSGTGPSGH